MTDEPSSRFWMLADAFESSPELELARTALANSPHATPPLWVHALARIGLSVEPSALTHVADAQGATAARRDSPVRVPVDLGLAGLGARAIQATETLGPFPGMAGNFWVDLYRPVAAHAVYEVGATRPAIVLTAARLPPIGLLLPLLRYTVEILGGSVWVRADKLDPGLPSDRYVGFTVSGGRLVFPSSPSVTGERLTCGAPLSALLDVELEDATERGGGLCSAIDDFTAPEHVSVNWGAAGAEIDLGPGNATVAGTAIRFVKRSPKHPPGKERWGPCIPSRAG